MLHGRCRGSLGLIRYALSSTSLQSPSHADSRSLPFACITAALENEIRFRCQEGEGQDLIPFRTASNSVEHKRQLESADSHRIRQRAAETRCISCLTNSRITVNTGSSRHKRISVTPSSPSPWHPISSIVRQDITCPASCRGVWSTKCGDAAGPSSSRPHIRWDQRARVACKWRRSVRCRGRRNVDCCWWQNGWNASESWIAERSTGSKGYDTDRGEESEETEK